MGGSKRSCDPSKPAKFVCPNFASCGYSHKREWPLQKHMESCAPIAKRSRAQEAEEDKPICTRSSQTLKELNKSSRGPGPISKEDVKLYVSQVLKKPADHFADSTVQAIVNFYGNSKVPASALTSVADLKAYVQQYRATQQSACDDDDEGDDDDQQARPQRKEGARKELIANKTKSNYQSTLQHILAIMGKKHLVDVSAQVSYLSKVNAESAVEATQDAMRSFTLLAFNPLEFANTYYRLRGNWVAMIDEMANYATSVLQGDLSEVCLLCLPSDFF